MSTPLVNQRVFPVRFLFAILWLGVDLFFSSPLGAQELTIGQEDMAQEVGSRKTYHFVGPEGQRQVAETAIVGRKLASKAVILREVLTFDGRDSGGLLEVVSPARAICYDAVSGELPNWEMPLPLRSGSTWTCDSSQGPIRCRVEGPEQVTVPAGTYTCLVLNMEHRDGSSVRYWFAPKVAAVKVISTGPGPFELRLAKSDGPAESRPELGATLVSHFDSGNPIVPLPFPKAKWSSLAGPSAVAHCEIDPRHGAAGTPFSLRFSFQTYDSWAHVGFVPSGTWGAPLELSAYEVISFYVKALKEDTLDFTLTSGPWGPGGPRDSRAPVKVTTDWQRVVIDLERDPNLEDADLSNLFGFRWEVGGSRANVVWIDQVSLYEDRGKVPGADPDEGGPRQ